MNLRTTLLFTCVHILVRCSGAPLKSNSGELLNALNDRGGSEYPSHSQGRILAGSTTISPEVYKSVEADVLRKQELQRSSQQDAQQTPESQRFHNLRATDQQVVAAVPVVQIAPVVDVVQPTQSQIQTIPSIHTTQPNFAVAAPVAQSRGFDLGKFLSSGAMQNMLSPKILGQSDAANQLIPRLMTPNLQQSLQQPQAGVQQNLPQQQLGGQPMQYNQLGQPMYPDVRQYNFPAQGQLGYPLQQGGIPNFGQASPFMGYPQAGQPLGGIMQQQPAVNYPQYNQGMYGNNLLPQG